MKVLWVGDACCSTGFARCTHAVCDELHERGHEVHVLGINFFGDPHDYPYFVYPCLNMADGGKDLFGEGRLPRMIKRAEPDVVVILQDPWNIPQYLERIRVELGGPETRYDDIELPIIIPWLAVDSSNQPAEYLNYCDHIVTWTEFAAKELKKGGYEGDSSIVPLGVDANHFYPHDKQESRQRVIPKKMSDDTYIIGVVGRNQRRKRLDLSIYYFAEWLKAYPNDNAWLYLHVAPTGDVGVDIDQVAKYYGIGHRLIKATPAVGVGAPDNLMPYLYSAFDLYWTTTSGEGWGLPTLEAMACGVPTLLPKFSGLGEWAEPAAAYMECSSIQPNAPLNVNQFTLGGVPDKGSAIQQLQTLYESPELRQDLSSRGLKLAETFTWSETGARMADIVENLGGLPKNVVTFEAKQGA